MKTAIAQTTHIPYSIKGVWCLKLTPVTIWWNYNLWAITGPTNAFASIYIVLYLPFNIHNCVEHIFKDILLNVHNIEILARHIILPIMQVPYNASLYSLMIRIVTSYCQDRIFNDSREAMHLFSYTSSWLNQRRGTALYTLFCEIFLSSHIRMI